jgi:hypothetical protein
VLANEPGGLGVGRTVQLLLLPFHCSASVTAVRCGLV